MATNSPPKAKAASPTRAGLPIVLLGLLAAIAVAALYVLVRWLGDAAGGGYWIEELLMFGLSYAALTLLLHLTIQARSPEPQPQDQGTVAQQNAELAELRTQASEYKDLLAAKAHALATCETAASAAAAMMETLRAQLAVAESQVLDAQAEVRNLQACLDDQDAAATELAQVKSEAAERERAAQSEIQRLQDLATEHARHVELEIKRLKEMEAFRREFLGDVSHELKTPIFAIEGFIETLLDGALDDPKVNRKFLQKAGKHAERMSNLVSDILVISQIESGQLTMNIESFCLYDMLAELMDSLSYKFTRKGRDIHYELIGNGLERALVKADKLRIEQVIRNLIDNAVKYGDNKGTIKVILQPHASGKLLVLVQDNGPGIEEQHIARLFERFYRVDKSRSRNKGGTGLGLAICKHFIEAHKERIWVESSPGSGATFQFTLAMAQ